MARFFTPLAVSILFVAWSPFIGEIRRVIQDAFPDRFVVLVTGLIGLTVLAAAAGAVIRIREHRAWRYAAILSALGAAVWYASWVSTGDPDVDAVERFHFVEYGLVGGLFYRAHLPARDASLVVMVLLWGLLVGTAEEGMQWLAPRRVGEARDIVLNLWAVGCGLVFAAGAQPPLPFSVKVGRRHARHAAMLAAAVVAALAVFYDAAHLGHDVQDDEIGRFRSHFSREGLLTLQRQRAVEWAADPPTGLPLVGIEDYYLTEAGSHVQVRNRSYAEGDFRAAWLENRILEKYWSPYLDLHSFSSGALHRWPPVQHAEVTSKAGDIAAARYVSPAQQETIAVSPSRRVFWGIAVTVEIVLVAIVLLIRP